MLKEAAKVSRAQNREEGQRSKGKMTWWAPIPQTSGKSTARPQLENHQSFARESLRLDSSLDLQFESGDTEEGDESMYCHCNCARQQSACFSRAGAHDCALMSYVLGLGTVGFSKMKIYSICLDP